MSEMQQSESSTVSVPFKLVKSRKSTVVMVNGYTYWQGTASKKGSPTKKVYYCSGKSHSGCKCSITIENGIVIRVVGVHNHPKPRCKKTSTGEYIRIPPRRGCIPKKTTEDEQDLQKKVLCL